MKKTLLALLLINMSLFAEESFEVKYREKIKEIIEQGQKDYPGNYSLQVLIIKTQIEELKEVEKLKEKYGVNL